MISFEESKDSRYSHESMLTCVCVVSCCPGSRGAKPDLTSRKGRAEFENRVCVSVINPVLQVRFRTAHVSTYCEHTLTHTLTLTNTLAACPVCNRHRNSCCNNNSRVITMFQDGGIWLRKYSGLAGNLKVASSIPGSSQPSVEVSLSETPQPDCSRRAGCRPAWS